MTIDNCQECGKDYNKEVVTIPNPIPQNMCFKCGSTLTDEEIQDLMTRLNSSMANQPEQNL